MNIVSRFVPSSNISESELGYILLPQELIGLYRLTHDLSALVAKLPLALKVKVISAVSHSEKLAIIEAELNRGHWVALGETPRRSPLNDIALSQFPNLKAAIYKAALSPQVQAQSSFKPITEDVALNPKREVVEAVTHPDLKIVVELAGQWPSNKAYLLLGKSGDQESKEVKPKPDVQSGHRSLVTFSGLSEEPRNIYMAIPRQGIPTPFTLLLAENVEPVDKSENKDEWDNVLVPVHAFAYKDASHSKANTCDLCSGYLYLFKAGELWRELKIEKNGFYREVDLHYYRQKEQQQRHEQESNIILEREAEGFPIPQFWVPMKINGEILEGESGIRLLFSPYQRPFYQLDELSENIEQLNAGTTPLDEIAEYSNSDTFTEQNHIANIGHCQLEVTEGDDMDWLSANGALVDSLKESNTAAAYVDGHNGGFVFKVEAGLDDGFTGDTPALCVVMEDANSEWRQAVPLKPATDESHGHYYRAIVSGMPSDGVFTLYVTSPADHDSAEVVFTDISYLEITGTASQLEPAFDAGNEPLPDSEVEQTIGQLQDLMAMWQSDIMAL